MTKWDYKGIFPIGAETESVSFWGYRGIESYAGNPLPAGVLDATATEITTPGNTKITVYAINTVAYQWQESPDGTTWSNIEGANKTEISREYPYAASSAGTYYFRCLCIGWLGIVPTEPIKITVRNHKPVALINPPSAAVRTPGTVEFSATTEYTESMQWQHSRDAAGWEDIPGAVTAELSQPFVYGDSGTHYIKLVASGLGGSEDSNISRVTVTDPEPQITISAELPPQLVIGDSIIFAATAEYTDTLEWQQQLIGGPWIAIPGETSDIYSRLCEAAGTVSIRCVAVGRGGTTISNIIQLVVRYPAPTAAITADKSELVIGEAATITAETTWTASLKWQHSTDGTEWEYLPGETSDELHVSPGTAGIHYYRAEIHGMDGSTTQSNELTITATEPEPEPPGPEPEP